MTRRWVLLLEGEKDCDRAAALGLVATCNPAGAGKFMEHHAGMLAGLPVACIPDNDKPGREHMDKAARLLHGVAAEVRVVELPGLPDKGDLSDFLDAGGTVELLLALVAAAGPFDPNGKPDEGAIAPRLNATLVRKVIPTSVEWMEDRYLAKGMLHGFYGDGGIGKSAQAVYFACRLSRGRTPFTNQPTSPVNSLFVLSEDSPEHTFRPRVDMFGGDLDRIHVVETVTDTTGAEVIWDAIKHGELVAEYVREHDIGLVVIDALSSAMGGADRNSEGQVRDSLTRLRQIAADTGTCVLGIGHLGKADTGRSAQHKALGSVAFTAVPRVVLMSAAHPENEQHLITGVVKLNLALKPPSYELRWTDAGSMEVVGESAIGIEEAFGGATKGASVEDAEEALSVELAGGMRRVREVEEALADLGIAKGTVRKAKERLKVEHKKIGTEWFWMLPAGSPQAATCTPERDAVQVETPPTEQVAPDNLTDQDDPEGVEQLARPNSHTNKLTDDGAEEVQEWL